MGNRSRFSLDRDNFPDLDAGLMKSFAEIANALIESGGKSDDLMERFEALAPQLPAEARRALSEYLLTLDAPPRALVMQLALDVPVAAEPLLAGHDFPASDLERLIGEASHAHCMILARRKDLPPSIATWLEQGELGRPAKPGEDPGINPGWFKPSERRKKPPSPESAEDINEALFGAFERLARDAPPRAGTHKGLDASDLDLVLQAITDLNEAKKPLQADEHYEALEQLSRAEMRLYRFLKRLARSMQTFSGPE